MWVAKCYNYEDGFNLIKNIINNEIKNDLNIYYNDDRSLLNILNYYPKKDINNIDNILNIHNFLLNNNNLII